MFPLADAVLLPREDGRHRCLRRRAGCQDGAGGPQRGVPREGVGSAALRLGRLFGLGIAESTGELIANTKKAPGSRPGAFLVKVRLLGTSYDFALAIAIPKKMPTMRPTLPAAMVAHVPACAAA